MGMKKRRRPTMPTGETRQRVWKARQYAYFSHQSHIWGLKLDRKFFSSLTPNTRVLEIGAGSGRLAEYLLRVSRLMPENYDLMDIAYGKDKPWMKRGIYKLAKEGKIRLIKGDMHSKKLPANHYDHILVPQAFFPQSFAVGYRTTDVFRELKKFPGREKYDIAVILDVSNLKKLVDRLKGALKPKGTIRVSFIDSQEAEYVMENGRLLFPEFDITVTRGAAIFELR